MKKKRTKKEKKPMSPQVKRTWISSVAAFVCVIIIAATLNSSAGKISDAIIKAADSAAPHQHRRMHSRRITVKIQLPRSSIIRLRLRRTPRHLLMQPKLSVKMPSLPNPQPKPPPK